MHKFLGIVAVALLAGVIGHGVIAQQDQPTPVAQPKPAEGGQKIPDATAVEILKIQRDLQGQQNIKQQIIAQAQGMIQSADKQIEHDQKELDQSKARALKDANLDPKEWEVDVDGLTFTKKSATPTNTPITGAGSKPIPKEELKKN